jgi:hypothetical protein
MCKNQSAPHISGAIRRKIVKKFLAALFALFVIGLSTPVGAQDIAFTQPTCPSTVRLEIGTLVYQDVLRSPNGLLGSVNEAGDFTVIACDQGSLQILHENATFWVQDPAMTLPITIVPVPTVQAGALVNADAQTAAFTSQTAAAYPSELDLLATSFTAFMMAGFDYSALTMATFDDLNPNSMETFALAATPDVLPSSNEGFGTVTLPAGESQIFGTLVGGAEMRMDVAGSNFFTVRFEAVEAPLDFELVLFYEDGSTVTVADSVSLDASGIGVFSDGVSNEVLVYVADPAASGITSFENPVGWVLTVNSTVENIFQLNQATHRRDVFRLVVPDTSNPTLPAAAAGAQAPVAQPAAVATAQPSPTPGTAVGELTAVGAQNEQGGGGKDAPLLPTAIPSGSGG